MSQKKYFIDRQRYDKACADLQIDDLRDKDGGKPWLKGYQADFLGCSRRMFNMYIAETDQKPIPWAKLQLLAKLLKCSAYWLCGEGDVKSKTDAVLEQIESNLDKLSALENLLRTIGVTITEKDGLYSFTLDDRTPMDRWNEEVSERMQFEKETYILPKHGYDLYMSYLLEKIMSDSKIFLRYLDAFSQGGATNGETIRISLDDSLPFN